MKSSNPRRRVVHGMRKLSPGVLRVRLVPPTSQTLFDRRRNDPPDKFLHVSLIMQAYVKPIIFRSKPEDEFDSPREGMYHGHRDRVHPSGVRDVAEIPRLCPVLAVHECTASHRSGDRGELSRRLPDHRRRGGRGRRSRGGRRLCSRRGRRDEDSLLLDHLERIHDDRRRDSGDERGGEEENKLEVGHFGLLRKKFYFR